MIIIRSSHQRQETMKTIRPMPLSSRSCDTTIRYRGKSASNSKKKITTPTSCNCCRRYSLLTCRGSRKIIIMELILNLFVKMVIILNVWHLQKVINWDEYVPPLVSHDDFIVYTDIRHGYDDTGLRSNFILRSVKRIGDYVRGVPCHPQTALKPVHVGSAT